MTHILGLGAWLPDAIRRNDAWPPAFVDAQATRLRSEFGAIQPTTGDSIDRIVASFASQELTDPFLGAVERRVAEPRMTAHAAETIAARQALKDAGIDGSMIGAVISSTAVPDRLTPPTSTAVAHAIGATGAFAIGVDAVCASVIVALKIASALIESRQVRHVLLTQSHLMTRAFPMTHPTSPNVGDAATALVIGPSTRAGLRAVEAATNGEFFDAVVWRRPKDADTPWWEPGGAMAMGSYDSDRARVLMQDTVRIGAGALREISERAGVRPESISVLSSVQPRRWIPHAIARAAGIPAHAVFETFAQYAHLGACGVVVNLLAARSVGALAGNVALYGQGAGFTRAAAIIQWT